jgi:hydrogenase maturation protease
VVSGQWSVVVIGYGNELRGDDAVGPRAAQAVAAWDVPGVCGLAVHQLTPELAELLATSALAIFVDARVPASGAAAGVSGCPAPAIEVRQLEPCGVNTALGHTGEPCVLLALAAALYGCCPPAWSIAIPAQSFAFGAGLSATAERGLVAALGQISELIGDRQNGETHERIEWDGLGTQRIPGCPPQSPSQIRIRGNGQGR